MRKVACGIAMAIIAAMALLNAAVVVAEAYYGNWLSAATSIVLIVGFAVLFCLFLDLARKGSRT